MEPDVGTSEAHQIRAKIPSRTISASPRGHSLSFGKKGPGRWYINELMLQNIGKRAKYFGDEIRFHPGPTSMI
jgi:hypothetical protein